MLINALLVLFGCYALYRGGDWLIDGVKGIGEDLGWSPAVIGLLLVSVGTSAPELFVSVGAAVQGFGDIAAGNAIGSNIVNLALVLGIGAVISVLPVSADMARRHIPVMVGVTVVGVLFLGDGYLTRIDALVLMVVAVLGLAWALRGETATAADEPSPTEDKRPLSKYLQSAGLGVLALGVGAEALIAGGSGLATTFGVSDAVIALTVTSIGTGLPEIVATVFAVLRREVEMAIANIVGSNIMNLGLVLGVSGLITPLDARGLGVPTLAYLAALTVLLLVLGIRPARIGRVAGAGLLFSYAGYLVWLLSA